MLKIQSMNIEASRGVNMMLRFGVFVIAVAMAGAVCNAQKQDAPASTSATAETSNVANAHPLRLSSGDLLDVKVLGTTDPDFAPKLRVDETGSISLPYAGPVKVAGRTAEDAGLLIEATYRDKDVLKNPHVSVTVLEYATQGVTVGGEVKNPGVYPLLGTHNLLDLLAAAGGVTPTAGKGVTISHRDDPTHPQVVNVETKPGSAAAFNMDIRPGDTIVVSKAGIVYVLGEVGKPGGFLIENSDRLTILQAVALAQGTTRTASLDHTKLIRKTPAGHSETQIALKKILADKSEDQLLADGDILFIPTSGPKSAFRDAESILPGAASAAIYHVP
jgi:polysaccharide export outer membrane protein